ncbi:MAG: hypothetical protein WCH11_01455 [Bdellovibrio sp.]
MLFLFSVLLWSQTPSEVESRFGSSIGYIPMSLHEELEKPRNLISLGLLDHQVVSKTWFLSPGEYAALSPNSRAIYIQMKRSFFQTGSEALRFGLGLSESRGRLTVPGLSLSEPSQISSVYSLIGSFGIEKTWKPLYLIQIGLGADLESYFLRHTSSLAGSERERGETFMNFLGILRMNWPGSRFSLTAEAGTAWSFLGGQGSRWALLGGLEF